MCVLFAKTAHAGEPESGIAEVRVGQPDDGGYASPPASREAPIADDASDDPARERRHRGHVRASIGPMAATTGRGGGVGFGTALDVGGDTIGLRFAAAWAHGEPGASADPRSFGDALGQYTAEATIDLHKDGPWHPVIAFGGGLLHVNEARGSAEAAIAVGRLTFEYAIPIDDAEMRVGAGVLGALTGPSDAALADLRGYGMAGATLSIGF